MREFRNKPEDEEDGKPGGDPPNPPGGGRY